MTHYYPIPIPITAEMEKTILKNQRQKKEQTHDEIFWFEREWKKEVAE